MKENSYFLIVLEEFKRFSICSSERSVFHMNSQRFKGYRCESGTAIFAWRITWNYAYSPFKTKTTKVIIKLKIFKTHFLNFLSFINLPCGTVKSHKKFGPDRFSRFDVYWIRWIDKRFDLVRLRVAEEVHLHLDAIHILTHCSNHV